MTAVSYTHLHGANHPVQDLASKRVFITSQNHGFAVDAASLPANARVTHVSLFDGTLPVSYTHLGVALGQQLV